MLNKQRLGAIFLFAGIILYGIIHIATIMHFPSVTVWTSTWGHYFEALSETGGWVGFVMALLLFVTGLVLLLTVLMGYFSKGKMMQEIRERDREFDEQYRSNIRGSYDGQDR